MSDVRTHLEPTDRPSRSGKRRALVLTAAAIGGLAFVSFWTWALFFASKEPINKIGDESWMARAEAICVAADEERLRLADFREMQEASAQLVRERADIVDAATDIIERMLDDIVAETPDDAKGQDLIPQWEADYRGYIASRRDFSDRLRATGENAAFFEPEVGGIPVSEKLEVFAADNEMPSCSPPRDLTR